MNGLTSRQEWTHSHIARCSCGSWVVLTDRQFRDRQLYALAEDFRFPCPHINHRAMEATA
jgi:hypothetical protein